MRVISGEHRGRHLQAVPGKGTRPTTDKVKESIFNMIGPYFDGGVALDLYAGTGGLGIEALSRGMDKAVFVDADHKAHGVVKQNIETLKLTSRAELFKIDAGRALKALAKRSLQFDVVFLDPPYAYQKIAEEIRFLQEADMLAPDAWIVAETDAGVDLPEEIGKCVVTRVATYGDTKITLYLHDTDADSPDADQSSADEEHDPTDERGE
ncbi:16S rRNA (guanine(966)-N(2))-methyltransferase RsmD [Brevibacillus dissolubilis]|uniref:16S rRNA (guanine(966)-N(2))-methyltransferase RsmD n=1 Tax=Brevibacillus dissolubilis TaxID=1844116 RepID=UPI0011166691|nr:16S rRNA (guanine(966)-N(2))-methyltransferase RsmD [Brevibacillus dissolubilis]